MMTPDRWLAGAPCVEWYLPQDCADWPRFRHLRSAVVDAEPTAPLAFGRSCWAAIVGGHPVGMAWDWAEVARGVPALTDPNSLVSNLQFLAPDGQPIGELGATVCLSRLLHRLAWQAPVQALLRAWRPPSVLGSGPGLSPAPLTAVNSARRVCSQTRTRVQPE